MRRLLLCSVLAFCLGSTLVVQAQQAMMKPPPVLLIGREVIKPGKGTIHEKWEAGWPKAFAKANWTQHYLALSSMTGQGRALYLTGYESLAAWEKDFQAIGKNATLSAELDALSAKDGEYLEENRIAVFSYMPELSYKPDVPVAGTRYFLIVSIQVKPGHGDHFNAVRKIAREAHEKAGLDDHFAVYRLVAGRATGLYLIFIPMKSMAEMDAFPTLHGKAYQDALGESGQKALDDFTAQGQESAEPQLFAVSAKMSYVSKEWIDADPDFWKPAPAKPATKKAAPATP